VNQTWSSLDCWLLLACIVQYYWSWPAVEPGGIEGCIAGGGGCRRGMQDSEGASTEGCRVMQGNKCDAPCASPAFLVMHS
jgi:hypothetical protein